MSRTVNRDRIELARRDIASDDDLDRLAALYRFLGHPGRLKIVMALCRGEMCVCDLAAITGTSESAVSHQLRRFKDLYLVKSRRDGQVVYYDLEDEHVSALLDMGLNHIREK